MSLATDLQTVSTAAVSQLDPLWTVDNADQLESAMWDVLPGLVDQWSLAASAVAADWYDTQREQAGAPGAFQAIVEPMAELGVGALIGWAMEPVRQPTPDFAAAQYRAVGGVQKRVINSANYTITGSSKADPHAKGWVRRTRPDGCDFCRMVASNDRLYTEAAATFACHERCHCYAEPLWGGQQVDVRPYTPSQRTSSMSDAQRSAMNRQAHAWIKANLK